MIFETVIVGPLGVNCFILGCEDTKEGIIIDPGADTAKILDAVNRRGLKIKYVVNTHGHFDHVGANAAIIKATGAKLLVSEEDVYLLSRASKSASMYGATAEDSPLPDRYLVDGDEILFGKESLKILATPGHTPGGRCFYHKSSGRVITGDTLFADGVGRTDFPGCSFEALAKGIKEKLYTLPDETMAFPGHGPSTAIGHEKMHNPYVR